MKGNIQSVLFFLTVLFLTTTVKADENQGTLVRIPDTGQAVCYDNRRETSCPNPGTPFSGQDATIVTNPPAYKDNDDGTVTDLVTGLMWQKAVDSRKVSLTEAMRIAKTLDLGGYTDWRVPNIKELYSLIDFRGYTGTPNRSGFSSDIPSNATPYINTDYFDFLYGNTGDGERYIDAQWLTTSKYVGKTMRGDETLFGVNFADGRIKGYGYRRPGMRQDSKTFFVRYVRGREYGMNDFSDNGDGTVTDRSTKLMWMQKDSGKGMNWEDALNYCEELALAGRDDWRLPDAKELQYIVDYTRAPAVTDTPAIDPVFQTTAITNEADEKDYPFFWSSTTHLDGPVPASGAAYVSFGRAIGQMQGRVMDVHGAGAQRSDPKTGTPAIGHGPQGDAQRIYNFVRCVRGGNVSMGPQKAESSKDRYPNNVAKFRSMNQESTGREPQNRRQMQGRDMPRPGFVQHLDRDGDGKVSRIEFDGPPNRFDYHDTNHDGYLTEEEAPRTPPPTR